MHQCKRLPSACNLRKTSLLAKSFLATSCIQDGRWSKVEVSSSRSSIQSGSAAASVVDTLVETCSTNAANFGSCALSIGVVVAIGAPIICNVISDPNTIKIDAPAVNTQRCFLDLNVGITDNIADDGRAYCHNHANGQGTRTKVRGIGRASFHQRINDRSSSGATLDGRP
jgi:hypothetical protein